VLARKVADAELRRNSAGLAVAPCTRGKALASERGKSKTGGDDLFSTLERPNCFEGNAGGLEAGRCDRGESRFGNLVVLQRVVDDTW